MRAFIIIHTHVIKIEWRCTTIAVMLLMDARRAHQFKKKKCMRPVPIPPSPTGSHQYTGLVLATHARTDSCVHAPRNDELVDDCLRVPRAMLEMRLINLEPLPNWQWHKTILEFGDMIFFSLTDMFVLVNTTLYTQNLPIIPVTVLCKFKFCACSSYTTWCNSDFLIGYVWFHFISVSPVTQPLYY